MSVYIVIAFLLLLFLAELIYFRIADHFNIIDKPNHRSSHINVTIRGGGIIFTLSILLYALYCGITYPYFLAGLIIISSISFIDDINHLNNKLRLLIQLAAVALLFYQLHLFSLPFYWTIVALIFVIGSVNAINFMDGINGITGVYGLVVLVTLYIINSNSSFTESNILLAPIMAVLVFIFFNFRTKAKCFAGDVGSVGLAFIVVFFLLQLIIKTQNFNYVLLLLIYGLDAFTTILFRLIRKENILEAHRSHFYQYLANEKKKSHLLISAGYGLCQLIINFCIINFKPVTALVLILVLIISFILFVLLRFMLEGKTRLLGLTSK